jgi:hypothetical protein
MQVLKGPPKVQACRKQSQQQSQMIHVMLRPAVEFVCWAAHHPLGSHNVTACTWCCLISRCLVWLSLHVITW